MNQWMQTLVNFEVAIFKGASKCFLLSLQYHNTFEQSTPFSMMNNSQTIVEIIVGFFLSKEGKFSTHSIFINIIQKSNWIFRLGWPKRTTIHVQQMLLRCFNKFWIANARNELQLIYLKKIIYCQSFEICT